jgi:peptidoglycan/xylan/chitin deacetylase (PgdA/CDA1 family)
MRFAALLLVASSCTGEGPLGYDWDGRQVLCSVAVDDISHDAPWDTIDAEIQRAHDDGTVALFHAHDPTRTISLAAIERVLGLADAAGLAYVTYAELTPDAAPRPALALAFDDEYVDDWLQIAPALAAHGARVTFFVTRVAMYDAFLVSELSQLADMGHGVEAHSVNHLHARDYEAAYGVDAYVADEVLPSIQILEDMGYPVTSYAFPFGESDDALDAAVLQHVPKVRVSPGSCPE